MYFCWSRVTETMKKRSREHRKTDIQKLIRRQILLLRKFVERPTVVEDQGMVILQQRFKTKFILTTL